MKDVLQKTLNWDKTIKELVECEFTIVDSAENIEKFLENKDIVVTSITKSKYKLECFPLTYNNSYNEFKIPYTRYCFMIKCKLIRNATLGRAVFHIVSQTYEMDYNDIIQYMKNGY